MTRKKRVNDSKLREAIFFVATEDIIGKYREFVNGLDLSARDSKNILKGFIVRRLNEWAKMNEEEFFEIEVRVAKKYNEFMGRSK